jgi:low affinity Fe/Cu permease
MVRSSIFDRFSTSAARSAGHPVAFAAAVGLIVVWLVSGPLFGFGDT